MVAALSCALFASTALYTGCGKEKAEEKPVLVRSMEVTESSEAQQGSYAGTVRGRYETKMSFQVGGQIIARNVNVGSRVSPGEVLMLLDPKDVVQEANAGTAQVASARAQLNLAQANLARYSELYKEAAISASTLDQYQTNYDAAFAAYQQALAQSAEAHNAVGYTNLTAGASGVISSITAEEGQVVSAGETVMTLVQTNELEVEISVPESRVDTLAVGENVRVTFWALGSGADGVIREIAPMADSASRTYMVRVRIPSPPQGMELGMTADVVIPEGTAEGFVLPLSAIYQTGDMPEVWLIGDDDRLVLKQVTVEGFDSDSVRVSGLSAGDVVVTAGVHKLREGQEVRREADR